MSQADELQHRVEVFADQSIAFVKGLPVTLIARRMGGQFLDASTSVAAHYRAARRGRSHDEFTAKIGLVAEEADETVFWLDSSTGTDGWRPPAMPVDRQIDSEMEN